MTWDLGDNRPPREPLPPQRQNRPGGADALPDDIQDEVRPLSGQVVRDDGRGMPLIGGGEGQVARAGGQELESAGEGSLSAVFGDVKRSGNWVVPRKTSAFLLFGDMMLDLREAELQPGENRIEVFTVFGDVRLLVPPGLRVETHGSTLMGDASVELGSTPSQPGPYVSLYVSGGFGDVKVKAFAPGEKPSKRWRWF
mgnify:CR=1 FL=1